MVIVSFKTCLRFSLRFRKQAKSRPAWSVFHPAWVSFGITDHCVILQSGGGRRPHWPVCVDAVMSRRASWLDSVVLSHCSWAALVPRTWPVLRSWEREQEWLFLEMWHTFHFITCIHFWNKWIIQIIWNTLWTKPGTTQGDTASI